MSARQATGLGFIWVVPETQSPLRGRGGRHITAGPIDSKDTQKRLRFMELPSFLLFVGFECACAGLLLFRLSVFNLFEHLPALRLIQLQCGKSRLNAFGQQAVRARTRGEMKGFRVSGREREREGESAWGRDKTRHKDRCRQTDRERDRER